MAGWYEYHLMFLTGWIFNSLILGAIEMAGWKHLMSARKASAMSHKLNLIAGYPSMIGLVICFVFLYDSSNFQFPTYIIFVVSCCIVSYAGLFAAFLIHRRKEEYTNGDETQANGYLNRLRLSLLISFLAALLAAAAELHILTNWITKVIG